MSVSNFEIITDEKKWCELLKKVEYYDFYHTYSYHKLSKLEGETPVMIKFDMNKQLILFPLLLRKIFDTDYYDLTSVYGYAGPIGNVNADFDNTFFVKYFNNYLKENKIVSIFSRLNPFIPNQQKMLMNLGELVSLNKIVNIDLNQDVDEQRKGFSKLTKRNLNKARKLCYVEKGNKESDIDVFLDLYYENMKRVNAKAYYFFNKKYLKGFLKSNEYAADIFFAKLKETDQPISAAIIVKTNNIIQYHISGTKNDFLKLSPIRLLIDEARVLGSSENYKYFNLGGGLSNQIDSLFNFKATFSKDFKDFKVFKYIVDPLIYSELVDDFSNLEDKKDFFPEYRISS